ncbi:MAG: S9 family peptidase, partial [Candidatus Aminicenantes bacterium]|nr:S9 family peptidase [Candidatus Aminicenantes bacterium]
MSPKISSKHRTPLYFLCLLGVLTFALCAGSASAQDKYEKPPQEVLDVLNAPLPPALVLSPKRDMVVLAQPMIYPAIADLAEPMLRLAGLRFNPRNNAARGYIFYYTSLTLKRISDGVETPLALPAGVRRIGRPLWNADGTMFAFTNETPDRVELWVVDVATRAVKPLPGLRINPILFSAVQWMPDQRTLLVKLIPDDRSAPPQAPSVPPGPKIRESSGVAAASSTYEVRDVLKSPYDEDLFDYYTRSQIALVRLPLGEVIRIGKPDIFGGVSPAPGGKYLLVERIHRPYSYLCSFYRFPTEVDIVTAAGEPVEKIASLPLFDQVPIEGVPTGPRNYRWRPTEPATLSWAEALDGGNPKTKVPHRDRVMMKPVGAPAVELIRTEERFENIQWIEKGGLALVSDFDPDRRWTRTFVLDTGNPALKPRLLWSMSVD